MTQNMVKKFVLDVNEQQPEAKLTYIDDFCNILQNVQYYYAFQESNEV